MKVDVDFNPKTQAIQFRINGENRTDEALLNAIRASNPVLVWRNHEREGGWIYSDVAFEILLNMAVISNPVFVEHGRAVECQPNS